MAVEAVDSVMRVQSRYRDHCECQEVAGGGRPTIATIARAAPHIAIVTVSRPWYGALVAVLACNADRVIQLIVNAFVHFRFLLNRTFSLAI